MRLLQNKMYVPKDTLEQFKATGEINSSNNFYYLFNFPLIKKRDGKKEIRINEEIQRYAWNSNFLNNILNRQINILKKMKYIYKESIAEISWRLVVGLGGTHPAETSMTLHHIYGIPYIPGSAVKGATRHWIIFKDFNEKVEDFEKNDEFKKIFGDQSEAGKIIFLDAYPINEIKLSIDIINPHYPDYYTNPKSNPPADWQSPTPIKFLTIKDTKFKFHLLSKDENLLKKAYEWLKDAITNYGVGAKTTSGNGIFTLQ